MKIIPFQQEHLEILETDIVGRIPNMGAVIQLGTNYTYIDDGRIIGCGGIVPITAKTGSCWTSLSKYVKERPLPIIRLVRFNLEAMMDVMGMHRIETANVHDDQKKNRWCEALGFEYEGMMRYYDDQGQTYFRYAKYKGN